MCRYTPRHIHVHTHLFPWITLVGFPKPLTQDTLFDIQLLPLWPSCSGADRKGWSELSVYAHCDLLLLRPLTPIPYPVVPKTTTPHPPSSACLSPWEWLQVYGPSEIHVLSSSPLFIPWIASLLLNTMAVSELDSPLRMVCASHNSSLLTWHHPQGAAVQLLSLIIPPPVVEEQVCITQRLSHGSPLGQQDSLF